MYFASIGCRSHRVKDMPYSCLFVSFAIFSGQRNWRALYPRENMFAAQKSSPRDWICQLRCQSEKSLNKSKISFGSFFSKISHRIYRLYIIYKYICSFFWFALLSLYCVCVRLVEFSRCVWCLSRVNLVC